VLSYDSHYGFFLITLTGFFSTMVVCSVAYVRSFIHSEKMTDDDIQDIITNTTEDILNICGVTDSTIPDITMAIRYTVLANTLIYLKTTGELAPTIKVGNGQRQNTPDKDIEKYQKLADELTQPYINVKKSSFESTFSSPSYVVSFSDTCNGGRHGRY